MIKKILPLAALALAAAFTGCKTSGTKSAYAPNNVNILGIVKHEPASYAPVPVNTFALHTDELMDRKNFSGNRTTLLWGLVTIADY